MNQVPFLERWGRAAARRRRSILWATLAFVAFGALWGTGVVGRLETAGGYDAPSSQSQQEASLAASTFGRDAGDVVVLYASRSSAVTSTAARAAVTSTLAALPHTDVQSFATYWSTGSRTFLSANGRETYAVIELVGASDDARQASYDAVKADLAAPGLNDQVGGLVPTNEVITNQTSSDVKKAESISLPILLILLLLIFGSLTAASLPLAIGGIGILGSFTMLRLLTLFTGVSIFSVNITTILGLGLGIDYGLFMVTRFREELRHPGSVEDAVARTVATAGRTVAFSGITVAVALSGLLLFPETFLRSMGYGGVLTVVIDVLAALVVMPALLAVLGPRVNSLRIRPSVRREPKGIESGAWYRLTRRVMRRPVAVGLVIVVVLLALGSPFFQVAWGGTDATVLPAGAAPREVAEALNRDFPDNPTAPIEALVRFSGPVAASAVRTSDLAAYARRLGAVAGVTAVQVTGVRGDVARLDLEYRPAPNSKTAQAIVTRVRAVAPPAGSTRYVGGQSAELVDTLASLGSALPYMGLIVVLATFLLLFWAFGSLVLPLKAILMNILSLSVMFGVLVFVFQEGHLSRLLHFTANGTIDPSTPILMFAVMFGLSMDYEVFLLSRVREHYELTGDNEAAIATGMQHTGGVITGAALMLGVVIGSFAISGVTFTKEMGVGMIVALFVDATIVRLLLVPATMKLLGARNWWAPQPLKRLYSRYGVKEEFLPLDRGAINEPALS
jgi:RND superfamily putative drug exporter